MGERKRKGEAASPIGDGKKESGSEAASRKGVGVACLLRRRNITTMTKATSRRKILFGLPVPEG